MARVYLTYGDLRLAPAGSFLRCTGECQGEYSATSGDYFMMPDDKRIYCCGRPMRLQTKHVVYTDVKVGR